MADIQKRTKKNGEITYTARIRVKGYPVMSATFKRLTDAKTWAAPIESDMKKGKHIKDAEAKKHTLSELIERYIEVELPQRKSDHAKFKMQLLWWKDKIGAYALSDIKPAALSKCKEALHKEPSSKPKNGNTTRSNATVNRYLACLSVVFTYAVKEWGWMDENPLLKVTKMKEPRGRLRFLSKEEAEKLLEVCKNISYELYLCTLIAISTGARYGEITGLTWKNIDLEHKQFHFLDTKNGEDRGVPITSKVYKELIQFKKIRRLNSNYIFSSQDGSGILYLRGQFDRAVKTCKFEDFHFHDLRHTAASNLAMNGASLIEIADILGHKTLAMVKRYSHLTKKHTASLLERASEAMFS